MNCVLTVTPLKPNSPLKLWLRNSLLIDESVKNGGTALVQKYYFRADWQFALSLILNYASTAKIFYPAGLDMSKKYESKVQICSWLKSEQINILCLQV